MGRIRLNKKDRKRQVPAGTNKAIYVQGKPKEKFLGNKSKADLKRIGVKKGN